MGILGGIENDTTVTHDKNPIDGNKTEGAVKTNEEKETGDHRKTIVMDGPLSTIYTKALNLVFSNDRDEVVSAETQQMDAVLVADAHKWMKKKEKLKQDDMDKAAYVYVTSDEIASNQTADTFDDLRIALDMDTTAEKIVCIECLNEAKFQKIATLVNYAENHASKPKVFFNRKAVIDYLSR